VLRASTEEAGTVTSTQTSQPETEVITGAERARGIEAWLLLAAPDANKARKEWKKMGATLLRCGELFTVVCIPGPIVGAAADTDDPAGVDGFLAQVLDRVPVFATVGLNRYYAPVPGGAFYDWKVPGSACLSRATYVGVPAVHLTRYEPGVLYWASPMDTPGDLCDEVKVEALVLSGVRRLGENGPSERGAIS